MAESHISVSRRTRHWVFLGLFLVIGVTMASGVRIATGTSPQTERMFNFIGELPPGSILLVSFDHEASALPEIEPIALALLRHAFIKDLHIIGMALYPEGTAIGYRLLEQVAGEYNKVYGSDYAYLGFRPQYIAAILSLAESFERTFPQDYLSNRYEDLPVLAGVATYDDVAAVLSIADGSLTTHWMEYGAAQHDLTVLAGVTAAMVTTYDPYLASGQMRAMIGGLRGAAQYERLIGRGGGGARGMLAQSAAHVYVIVLIILGNIAYWRSRRTGGRS
ncbi:MAG: hypothetical protein ABIE70_04110 [bacterium]